MRYIQVYLRTMGEVHCSGPNGDGCSTEPYLQ